MDEKLSKKTIDFRPPVVAILGHVDHGKTTLLDYIRKTNTVSKEAGGITQKIGAYQIEFKGKKITFIDTPGHSAFEDMRSRGASVADIAILLVAADDGIKPQTIEAEKHIKNAGIPQIIAIGKIDLPNANPAKIKSQLAKQDILIEEMGGKIPTVELSAKTGKNIDDLLELILLIAELENIHVDKDLNFEAIVIESYLDKNKGPVATILVKSGYCQVGDEIGVENIFGKIKTIIDPIGQKLQKAMPSAPVEILGFKSAPPIGGIVFKLSDKMQQSKTILQVSSSPATTHSVMLEREEIKKRLKIIIKTDTQGSLEAIIANLPNDISVIHSTTGDVIESDVLLAKSVEAIIFGFNIKLQQSILKLAKSEKVEIKVFKVIYKLLEELETYLKEFKEKKLKKQIIGSAKIVAKFNIDNQTIAGCKVTSGIINLDAPARVIRNDKILSEVKINSLKTRKKDITVAREGSECGVSFIPDLDFEVGDSIELLAQNL